MVRGSQCRITSNRITTLVDMNLCKAPWIRFGPRHALTQCRKPEPATVTDLEVVHVQNAKVWEPSLGLGLCTCPQMKFASVRAIRVRPISTEHFGGHELHLVGEADFQDPERSEARPNVKVYQQIPGYLTGALIIDPAEIWIRVFGNYVRWSQFTEQCVARDDHPLSIVGLSMMASVTRKFSFSSAIPRNWEDGYAFV